MARVTPDSTPVGVLPRLGRHGPVVYGCSMNGRGAKESLLAPLVAALVRLEPRWAYLQEPWMPLRLGKDPLGRPFLTAGRDPAPAVSFSQAGGRTWAALAGAGQVGCDAAQAEEFSPGYPLGRVFHAAEWAHASRLCRGDTGRAAALLWSLKEAAVKALGVGFHLRAPLALKVSQPFAWHEGFLFQVSAGPCLPAWARPQGQGWLALALA